MAQRTTVVLIDDLDGSEADETVGFGLDGIEYEIDLAARNAGALRDELAPYVEHARRLGRTGRAPASAPAGGTPERPTTVRRVGGGTARVDREQNRAIREWATRHGHPLSARGRIPSAVAEAYHSGDPNALPRPDDEPTATEPTATEPTVTEPTVTEVAATPAPEPTPEPAPAPEAEPGAKRGPDGLTGEERERIRAWAVDEGIEVKARGRLTKDLIANYQAVQARR